MKRRLGAIWLSVVAINLVAVPLLLPGTRKLEVSGLPVGAQEATLWLRRPRYDQANKRGRHSRAEQGVKRRAQTLE